MRGQIQGCKWHQAILLVVAMALAAAPAAAQAVHGTGTTNKVPLWIDSSTLGSSALSQSGGNLTTGGGITAASFTGGGSALTNVNAAKLGGILPSGFAQLGAASNTFTGGIAAASFTGNGSALTNVNAAELGGILPGGFAQLGANNTFTGSNTFTGPGGAVGTDAPVALEVFGGTGGSGSTGGAGGAIRLTAGNGSLSTADVGGAGGGILITGGMGGPSTIENGNGGSITLQPGAHGTDRSGIPGSPGNVILAPSGGRVGVGTTTPANTLEVVAGGTTLADAWTTRSSRRLKTNIQTLEGALEKVLQLRGVSYDSKAGGKHEIGVIAEEVGQVVPEVVSYAQNGVDAQGVDYSRLTALLIEALKSQQAEIRELKERVDQLTSKAARN